MVRKKKSSLGSSNNNNDIVIISDGEKVVSDVANEEAGRPFDLTNGPLIRGSVVKNVLSSSSAANDDYHQHDTSSAANDDYHQHDTSSAANDDYHQHDNDYHNQHHLGEREVKDEYVVLLLNMHHVVSDGWSMESFSKNCRYFMDTFLLVVIIMMILLSIHQNTQPKRKKRIRI